MGQPYDEDVTGEQKRSWRAERRARRVAIATRRDALADAEALAREILALLEAEGVESGDIVTLYESISHEPATDVTLQALSQRGIRVLLPITLPDLDLDWFFADDPQRRPLGLDAIARARVILAPGLAVDHRGMRLGQGGGCYDKALPRRRAGVPVHVILHPGEQVDGELPSEPHDQYVDGVVTAEAAVRLP